MTSFFHDLEDQLRTAAHQRVSGAGAPGDGPRGPKRGRGRWGWLAGGARAIPLALAVAVTLAVVVGALVLLGHRGGQPPMPPASGNPANAFAALIERTPTARLRQEYALLGAATRKLQGSAVCRVPQPRHVPQIHGEPGHALLSTLGVLRRPATAADRLPADSLPTGGAGLAVYAGAMRRAATIGQTRYYFVPVREDPAAYIPSARCLALQNDTITKALPTFPAALRGDIRDIGAALVAYERELATKPPVDEVCEVTVQRNGGGNSCSETPQEIRNGTFPGDDNGTFSGIVPDGVASVTLSLPATAGRAARSVTATVHGNVYAVHAGAGRTAEPGSATITWRAADARVLKTYSVPAQLTLKTLCREHPDACLSAALVLGGTTSSAGGSSASSSSSSSSSSSATTASPPSARPKGSRSSGR
jgi:hypothetical protein